MQPSRSHAVSYSSADAEPYATDAKPYAESDRLNAIDQRLRQRNSIRWTRCILQLDASGASMFIHPCLFLRLVLCFK